MSSVPKILHKDWAQVFVGVSEDMRQSSGGYMFEGKQRQSRAGVLIVKIRVSEGRDAGGE